MAQTSLNLFLWVTTAVTAVLALWLTRVAWRYRPTPGAKTLAWLMLAIAGRSGAHWLIFAVDDPELRLSIAKISYFMVASTPVLGMIFVLSYTGFSRRFNRHTPLLAWLPLWIIPGVASLLVLTYPWNRLIWQVWVSNPGAYATITFGPLQALVTAYLWGLLVFAGLLMSWYAFAVRGVHRRTALMVAAAMLIPIVPNALWLLRMPFDTPYDFTYLGMLASALLLLLAVQRGSFLDVRPIAYDVLMEQMTDAILVVDGKLRVVDGNRAAVVDLGVARVPLGDALPGLLAQWLAPDPAASLGDEESAGPLLDAFTRGTGDDGILVLTRPALRHLHWRISPLRTREKLPVAGWILTWRDVTQDRLKLAMLYEQERALSMVAERERHERDLAARMRAVLDYTLQVGRSALDAVETGDLAAGATSLAQLIAVAGVADGGTGYVLPPAEHDRPTGLAFLDALASFLHNYGRTIGCTVEFACSDPKIPGMLSPWVLVQLVRILQETLEGIHRQLDLHSMHVSLAADSVWVVVAISLVHDPAAERMQGTMQAEADTVADTVPPAPAGTGKVTGNLDERSRDIFLPDLAQGSIQQRLAAANGTLTLERLHASHGRVRICLPRTPPQQHMLFGQQVLIAAQPATIEQLRTILMRQGMQVVGATGDVEELAGMARTTGPRLILVELALIAAQFANVLRRLRHSAGQARIVVIQATGESETSPGEAVRLGADGYVTLAHDSAQFQAALANLLVDTPPFLPELAGELLAVRPASVATAQGSELSSLGLTDRQREILSLVVRGFTYQEIAAQLYVSERTVRYDAEEIRRRMQVPSRAAMVEYAVKHRLT